jgi:DNA phosphorothioation-dependent restriction protein DptH
MADGDEGLMSSPTPAKAAITPLKYHALLCSSEKVTPQLGILGESLDDNERIVAMDLTYMNCIGFFGEPGSGKSYSMGTILEMGLVHCPNINRLEKGIATVVFHYSPKQAYRPEAASMIAANDIAAQVDRLKEKFGADPRGIADCIILAPKDVIALRQSQFPDIPVHGLTFTSRELQAEHWKILMGALGETESMYLQVINKILKSHRAGTTIAKVREDVGTSVLSSDDKDKAHIRLDLAEQYIDDGAPDLKSHIKSGRLIIVDLRDEFLQRKEALALLIVLLQIFAEATDAGKPLQKMCVFDEAHKYMKDPVLVECLVETIREMRHASISIMIASQEPESVPQIAITLMSMIVFLKTSSPLSLANVAAVKPAYNELTPHKLANLKPGEAYIWAKYASDEAYTMKPYKVRIRPRFSKHGGDTKVAVDLKNTVDRGSAPGSAEH